MSKIIKHICLNLFVLFLFTSCAHLGFPEFREENPNEDKIYSKIQELRKSERYILASEYSKKFISTFPNSKRNEELAIFIADHQSQTENYKEAEKSYESFIQTYPASPKLSYAQEQVSKMRHEKTAFHKHFDVNILIGPVLSSSGDLSKNTSSNRGMTDFSISYFFSQQNGVYFGANGSHFRADPKKMSYANNRKNKDIGVYLYSIGYLHRWKPSRKTNLVYGIGGGSLVTKFTDGKSPNSNSSLGLQQSLTLDYCILRESEDPCWDHARPSIGLFHIFSPNGKVSSSKLNGNIIGLAVGFKF